MQCLKDDKQEEYEMQNRTLRITSRQAIAMLISLALMILSMVFYSLSSASSMPFSASVIVSFVYAIISYLLILYSMYHVTKRIDFFFLFVVLSFPFMFGRHIIYILDMVPIGREAFRTVLSNEAYIQTSYYCIAAISAMFFGYLLVKKKKATIDEMRKTKQSINERKAKTLYKVCLVFAAISIVPYIITSINDIEVTRLYGYGYRIVEGTANETNVITILSGLQLPALIGMLISREKKEWVSIALLIFYFVVYTFTGSRINTFCYIILFVYLYLYWGRRFKKKIKLGRIVIVGVVVAFIFSIISSTRSLTHEMTVSNAVIESASNIWKSNPFSSILYETGNTYIATSAVVQHCPGDVPYIWGISYICSFIYIIPNSFTGNFVGNYTFTDEAIAHYLTAYGGVGSSYVAEAYYNFGAVGGLIALVIIGFIWGKICAKTEKAILSGNPVLFYLYCQLFIAMVFMVRSDMVYRLRPFAWYTIPIVVITMLLQKGNKGNES